ncbi:hypothetical protein ACFOTA_22785 [Chitinophaga sp. GCM10012297]|uniref:ATP synthase protein I n=1 Tax=Chitinophaga chungangae TaxID=2821488 RepID=A0ABS3YK48_9BACT|nr:hypothetical protein [Chitinophaga chungangae]MBO9155058.1 hypothetical protein [Chitinophaga chungangae]
MTDKFILWLAGVFVLITAALFLLQQWLLQSLGAHFEVLVAGNIVMALITLISYSMNRKGMAAANPNVFVRSVYASTLSKLMLCAVGIIAYVLLNRQRVSKSTIFLLLFFYLVYTVFETIHLYRVMIKQKKS